MHLEIRTDRGADKPLYLQIAGSISRLIASGVLGAGERLPTVRELARQLKVTRVTVHNAYSHLQAEALVESTVGRGTFVSGAAAGQEPHEGRGSRRSGIHPDRWHGPEEMGMLLMHDKDLESLALAAPDPRLAPTEEFMEVLKGLSAADLPLLRYGATEGDPKLRELLSRRLAGRGIRCETADVLITTGSTQAISLTVQALARPGEKILVESPAYFGFLSLLRALEIHAVPVPMDMEGPIPDDLERLVLRERPRLFYTTPTFHNPTGLTMTLERRRRILDIAYRYGLPIIEDDIFHALSYQSEIPAPIRALDDRGVVFYVDSFSKSLLPGLRIGYVVAPQAQRRVIASLHSAATLGSAHVLQRALARFVEDGKYDAHLRRVIPHYRRRRDALLRALKREMPREAVWTSPGGGFCCWLTLPDGLSSDEIFRVALQRGIAFAPGRLFEVHPRRPDHARLCFGTLPPERLGQAVEVLARTVKEGLGRVRAFPEQLRRMAPLV